MDDGYSRLQQQRLSDFKGHVHRASIGILWGILLLYGAAALCWFYHLLAPEAWHFMPEDNHATLQSLLFGTIVGGLASRFASKVFSD